jgi:hypothetical protein
MPSVDQSVLQFLVTAIAAGASLTAVLLGIDQLSSGGRIRNLESVLRAAIATPDGTARDDVVVSLHRTSLGRLIAREAVPFRSFLVPALLAIVPWATAVRAALFPSVKATDILAVALSWPFVVIAIQQVTNLVRERTRLRMWFEQGRTPLRAFTRLSDWLGGSDRQLGLAVAEAASSLVGVYCLVRAFEQNIHTLLGQILLLTAWFSTLLVGFLILATVKVVVADLSEEIPSVAVHGRPSWIQPLPSTTPTCGPEKADEPKPVDDPGPTSVPLEGAGGLVLDSAEGAREASGCECQDLGKAAAVRAGLDVVEEHRPGLDPG